MTSISSISGSAPVAQIRAASGTAATEGDYEANARAFGPLVATAIGAAEAAGATAGAVVSFSSESLHRLEDAIGSGYDTVRSGVSGVADGIAHLAQDGVAAVESAYDEAADTVSSIAGSVGDTVGSALDTVGKYAALGLAAGRQLISEIV